VVRRGPHGKTELRFAWFDQEFLPFERSPERKSAIHPEPEPGLLVAFNRDLGNRGSSLKGPYTSPGPRGLAIAFTGVARVGGLVRALASSSRRHLGIPALFPHSFEPKGGRLTTLP
jgi:hypothetical protein